MDTHAQGTLTALEEAEAAITDRGSPPAVTRSEGRTLLRSPELLCLLGVLLLLVAFSGGLADLMRRWRTQEEYSHGFFIPLISAWFLWQRRDGLRQSRGDPSPSGWQLVLASGLMLVVGEFTATFLLIQLGFLLGLAGLVLAYGGSSLLRVSALPIALLLFCIPLPYFIDSQLSWRLQLVSSDLGVTALRALGYSVYREGNVIDLGTYMLQVVDACSGLRYLYPLLSVGFLMAYMYPAAMRWRVLLVFSTVPITIITNSVRIALVGVLVERWGSSMADGFLHAFEGWAIFLVCQAILILEIALIERFTLRRSIVDVQQLPRIAPVPPCRTARRLRLHPMVPALVSIAVCMVISLALGKREEVKPQRASLRTFPLELAGWRASESSLSAEVERTLGLSDYVLADYGRGDTSQRVNFYAAYYATQRKGVSPHSPQVCIPGGGWVISGIQRVGFALADGSDMQAVRVVIDKDGQRALVYYWFDERGRRIANEYMMKWYLLLDSLTRNRTDGALVRVVTAVSRGESQQAADQRLQTFIRAAVPALPKFIPG